MYFRTPICLVNLEDKVDYENFREITVITNKTTLNSNTYNISAEEELTLFGSITNTHKVSIVRGRITKPFTHIVIDDEYYKVVNEEYFRGKTAYTLELVVVDVHVEEVEVDE